VASSGGALRPLLPRGERERGRLEYGLARVCGRAEDSRANAKGELNLKR